MADSTNNADGTVSAGAVGDALVSTNSTSCVGSPLICGNLGGATTFYDNTTWDGATGTVVGSTTSNGITALSTYNIAVAEVPVPAAAWLFGSALLGLTGIARRRARS